MNRRKSIKLIGSGIGALWLALNGIGCSSKTEPKTIEVNGIKYQIQNGVISQEVKGDNKLKLGVMADLHAHTDNTKYFVKQLEQEGVEVYILPGDLSHSFGDSQRDSDDHKEIISVVEPIAETKKLVLAMPGNHEKREIYNSAMKDLASRYQNVVDMEKVPVAELDDLTIVAMGGNANPRFCIPDGFLRDEYNFNRLRQLVKEYQDNKPLLVATHAPRTYRTSRGLDVIDSGRNVGLFEPFKTHRVSAHIHEAYGIITPDERSVKQGELAELIEFNPGAVYDHCHASRSRKLKPAAGMMEFEGTKARAYIINR